MSSPCKNNAVRTIMSEFKSGVLESSSGQKVKNRRQALAIALSIAERDCSYVLLSNGKRRKITKKNGKKMYRNDRGKLVKVRKNQKIILG